MAPSGPTPESPPYSSSQNPDCVKPPGAPPQRSRLPEAVEPLSREASLLHSVNYQLSQDWELGTDLRSLTSTLHMRPKEVPRELNRWDSTGPATVLEFGKSRLPSALLTAEPRWRRD